MMILLVLALPLISGAALAQDVTITLENFGVKSVYRPGDMTGIRFRLLSSLEQPVNVRLVWEAPEAVGDIIEHTRDIALTPGQPALVWMYGILPTHDKMTNQTLWTIRVFELDEQGRRGRELGASKVSPQTAQQAGQPVPPIDGMIGVISQSMTNAGLGDYMVSSPGSQRPASFNEALRVINGIGLTDLPDRWFGLASFRTLVWAEIGPIGLRDAAAEAIRDYIRFGGHLVILLPQAGNDWGLGAPPMHLLHDLLPQHAPQMRDMTLRELLPVLSKRSEVPEVIGDLRLPVRIFTQLDNHYEPLFVLEDGELIGVQRTYGFGHISVIGIDPGSGTLAGTAAFVPGGVFETDVFWNRVLGRRGDTLKPRQLALLSDERRLRRSAIPLTVGTGPMFIEMISLSGSALAGLGLAFILFVAYWLLAGPIGFALLKGSNRLRHSWIAFALLGLVFTIVALGSVRVLRENDTRMQHITYLDHIARLPGQTRLDDPQYQRITSWFTLFLPGYLPLEVDLESEPGLRNLISGFSAPSVPVTPFANVDRYTVAVNSKHRYTVPARATTKEMYARWIGSVDEAWSRPFTVDQPLEMQGDVLVGAITSRLPAALDSVTIIINKPRRTVQPVYADRTGQDPALVGRGGVLNVGELWSISRLEPGQTIDFSRPAPGTASPALERAIATRFGDNISPSTTAGLTTSLNTNQRLLQLQALSLFEHLQPPDYLVLSRQDVDAARTYERVMAREIDLSAWMNRPCVIIIGYINNAESPLPLSIGGVRPQSEGVTIVRWIHPLPMPTEFAQPVNPPREPAQQPEPVP